jgi:hypothetical protein
VAAAQNWATYPFLVFSGIVHAGRCDAERGCDLEVEVLEVLEVIKF